MAERVSGGRGSNAPLGRTQRIVKRNWTLSVLPWLALGVAGVMLIWEIVRQNLPEAVRAQWPWRLQLLDLESGATVVTVVAALTLTRMQYAQAVRPSIRFMITLTEGIFEELNQTDLHSAQWKLEMTNGGSSIVTVESIEYRIAPVHAVSSEEFRWLAYGDARQAIKAAGLTEWKDFRLHRAGPGLPLSAANSRDVLLLTITTAAMLRLEMLDLRLGVKDALGDRHEIFLPCREVFPVQLDSPESAEPLSADTPPAPRNPEAESAAAA
ncbi:hypothetical protein Acy02nite_09890 [Actinoplanes cyaneus]|uniref:Uncharacterized protein n=1 Tax=Actinoplanes cyaneus TaxID=52696 RepID=A0A919ICK1_9ACTN|nr:hypothetical protein [Actinoplanes cyaneus]MCW2137059.1 hypothetical protein [Actinoplanes cyaneus]GID63108.1 hypothetical protein Acy02nite_09890 [Actinoplanes cyaneus]